jgi:hypothetical protein
MRMETWCDSGTVRTYARPVIPHKTALCVIRSLRLFSVVRWPDVFIESIQQSLLELDDI